MSTHRMHFFQKKIKKIFNDINGLEAPRIKVLISFSFFLKKIVYIFIVMV